MVPKWISYLSDSCPEMKEPTSTPTKNKEMLSGAFQSSSHTRSHWKRSKGTRQSLFNKSKTS